MNIFGGLFNGFTRSNQPGRNYKDKTPYKVQVMNRSLTGMNVSCAGYVYRLFVPKRLYKRYIEAFDKESNGKELTPMEKTYLYGYLNPKYHSAIYPRKRIR